MSLKLPKANNVQEFADNLYNKRVCTEESSYRYGKSLNPDLPKRMGLLQTLTEFDAGYFGTYYNNSYFNKCRVWNGLIWRHISSGGHLHGSNVQDADGVHVWSHPGRWSQCSGLQGHQDGHLHWGVHFRERGCFLFGETSGGNFLHRSVRVVIYK